MLYQVMHGTNAKFKAFGKASRKSKRIENDLFGGGIGYFTDDRKVALTYSRAMTNRYGGEEYLYKVDLNLDKVFDVDTVYSGDSLQKFWAHIKPETLARGAGLLKNGADKYSVLASLELGNIELTGHDVWNGLSSGNVNSSGAEKILMKLGYDGLRYNGGDNIMAQKHNVYIPYYSGDIKIRNTFKVNRRVIAESLSMPEIGHLTFSRDLLPQIVDQDEFTDHLSLLGIRHRRMSLSPQDMKATQSDGFDMKKVAAIIMMQQNGPAQPVLVSSDHFILDGHHRWIAAFNQKKHTLLALLIDAPILELIRIAADFYNSQYADYIMSEGFAPVNEIFGGPMRTHEVLYHHFSVEKAIDMFGTDRMVATWKHIIPQVHKKRAYPDTKYFDHIRQGGGRETKGNSLTRNINLTYEYHTKIYIIELDRKKMLDNNKLHVLDADLVAGEVDPRANYFDMTSRSRTRIIANFRAKSRGLSNEFAEEFLEGDLAPLHKFTRCIWLKRDKGNLSVEKYVGAHDSLTNWAITWGIPVKYYPSGKDAMADLVDWVSNKVEYDLNKSRMRNKDLPDVDFGTTPDEVITNWDRFRRAEIEAGERAGLSRTVANIRKSINTGLRL